MMVNVSRLNLLDVDPKVVEGMRIDYEGGRLLLSWAISAK